MKYLLPKRNLSKNLNRDLQVNEIDGSSYKLKIYNDPINSYIEVDKKLTTRGKQYLIRLGLLEPYGFITYVVYSKIYNLLDAFKKFGNFRLVIDRSESLALIPFYDYEKLQYTEIDNIPENAFATTYSTVTYTKFEYRNNEPGDNLHFDYTSGYYNYFSGYVKPRDDKKVVWFNNNFIKVNNHCGFYNVNGIRLYILTDYLIFGQKSHGEKLKFNNIKITEIDKVTLNSILGIFTKYNFQPSINESGIFASDSHNLIFVGKINNTQFDKYLSYE